MQYAAIIAAPNTTDSQTVEQQVNNYTISIMMILIIIILQVRNSLNNENFMGNTEVLQVKAKTQK